MAYRPRTSAFRPQLSVRRVYETLQPTSEMKEIPEAYLLNIYLPGFTKDVIKITYEHSSGMIRITGERQIRGNRWSRFDQTYPFPENSEAEKVEAKFELGTLVLTMPKKFVSQVAPKPEVQTSQDISPSPSEKAIAEGKPEKTQDTIPPQSQETQEVEETSEDKKSASLPSTLKGPDEFKAQKTTQEDTSSQKPVESQMVEDEKALKAFIPPEPIRDHSPQKGKEEVAEKPIVTSEPQTGKEEFEPKPTPTIATKIQTDENIPKGEEEAEPKPTLTTVTRDPKEEDKPQEEARIATVEKQLEEKTVGKSDEDAQKERISKKGVKEKDKEKGGFKEKKTRTRKLTPEEAEPSAPKVPEKEKESSNRTVLNQQGKREEDIIDTVRNGITDLAVCASQVVTRIAEGKWNHAEKHLAVNIGAAVLVIAALGAYVSHRFTS
ncbi:inactive protein RESTRICTED TEV MOVEMENT 2-like [Gastrolobium bilobum]|uniref:inactive protein RESTRICTED TEV MOVEMENT 2-like n=1 Tax=Gastrolobium bilobum TaxID=150636 RepID=UPI002AB0800A|nr:inactive protein RESTRICTED TEV MOVEMENT 2-like [Gastrolobium bilobum]